MNRYTTDLPETMRIGITDEFLKELTLRLTGKEKGFSKYAEISGVLYRKNRTAPLSFPEDRLGIYLDQSNLIYITSFGLAFKLGKGSLSQSEFYTVEIDKLIMTLRKGRSYGWQKRSLL